MSMLTTLIYKLLLFSCGIVLVVLARFVHDLVVSRRILHSIPGPKPSSLIWGEEWKLYSHAPGQPYTDWHEQYGSIVRFRGAFGVCVCISYRFAFVPTPVYLAPSRIYHRPPGYFIHSRRECIPIPEGQRCSCLVQGYVGGGYSLGRR